MSQSKVKVEVRCRAKWCINQCYKQLQLVSKRRNEDLNVFICLSLSLSSPPSPFSLSSFPSLLVSLSPSLSFSISLFLHYPFISLSLSLISYHSFSLLHVQSLYSNCFQFPISFSSSLKTSSEASSPCQTFCDLINLVGNEALL